MKKIEEITINNPISENISQNRGIANSSRDPLTQQRAEKGAEDGERIMKVIDQDGETVGKMGVLVMPLSKEDDTFTKLCRRVESSFAGIRCKIRCIFHSISNGIRIFQS